MPLHSKKVLAKSSQEPQILDRWLQALAMFLTVVAIYLALRNTGTFSFSTSAEGALGLGAIFLLGLVAASSTCLAAVGGLLLSVSAKWAESHQRTTKGQRLRPMLLFNAGRLLGYFIFGGLVGILGTAITFSTRGTGYLTLFVSIVMIVLGLNLLRILPKRFCRLPLPRSVTRKIGKLADSQSSGAALLLGAFTFFLPCGFTQSMQLLALASGSFLQGGLIMLFFALGTLPALLGISLASSLLEGRAARSFLTFSGAVVLFLGLLNFHNGLVLTGTDASGFFRNATKLLTGREPSITSKDPYVSISPDGRQIITVHVSDDGYVPNTFTIEAGKETWVYAVAKESLSGCANFLTSPSHNLVTVVNKGPNWLGPITNPDRDFLLTCSMGRLRAEVKVRGS